MDIEKLIERLKSKDFERDYDCTPFECGAFGLLDDAADALSTLQGENEEMQKQLNMFSEFLCYMTGGLLSKTNYTAQEMVTAAEDYQQKVCGECDLRAENEKLRAELEQVRRERDAAQSLLAERIGVRGAEPITTAFGLPIDRLRELAQADREGRCVVLNMPRKPLVWGDDDKETCLCPYCGKDLMGIPYGERMVLQCPECGQYLDDTKVITRAEAEDALQGEREEKQ